MISRGGRPYRGDAIAAALRAGYGPVLVVLKPNDEVDELAGRVPEARFVVPREELEPGEAVNLAVRESGSDFVAVFWDDLLPVTAPPAARALERMESLSCACFVPRLEDREGNALPFAVEPALERGFLRIVATDNDRDGARALCPPDFAGIYDRRRFLALGGFDHAIANPYWQRAEFGFRAWMFGERVRLHPALKLRYGGEVPTEDSTYDESYARFYLSRLAVIYRGDSGHLPWSRFPAYAARCGRPFAKALGEFSRARERVAAETYRFKSDAASVIDLWEEDIE